MSTLHISCIEDLIQESKKFLQELGTQEKNIIVQLVGQDKLVQLYQENNYVFLVPDCDETQTLLYGNWEEALHATKRQLQTI